MGAKEIKALYTTCVCNCGGTSQCAPKVYVQGNRVIRVEPDDRYNSDMDREDYRMTDEDLFHNRLQRRPSHVAIFPLKRSPIFLAPFIKNLALPKLI